MARQLIDLSHPLAPETEPWPGNPEVNITFLNAIHLPDSRCNVTAFSTCTHTGTHLDAPSHFYDRVRTIDQIPLSQCFGRAVLVRVSKKDPRGEITIEELMPSEAAIRRTRKLVLNTGWSDRWGRRNYFTEYPVLAESTAEWLVKRGIELVGVDTPSVDYEPNPVHYALLAANAVIVENLTNLNRIQRAEFDLAVLPLPLTGLEASPVRAVAIIEE